MRIDNIPDNQLVTTLNKLIETRDSLKDRQFIGKHSHHLNRVSTANTYDIQHSMNVEYKRYQLSYTPDNTSLNQGAAYKLFVIQTHDNAQASVDWVRLPLETGSNVQKWLVVLHNFTRQPGSPSPQTFIMRAKFYLTASDTGTLSVVPV